MKKVLKILLTIFLTGLILISAIFLYFNMLVNDIKLDTKKLISFNQTIVFYDDNLNVIQEECNGKQVTDFSSIPSHTKNAFISVEDKRFYTHNGIDYKGLIRASINNLKALSFKEGASTISQQLIKNTHLSSEKTLKRKIAEIKLAKKLEKKYTKNEILEKYLNTIYFGDNCYGIASASEHYFNKKPQDLNLNQSAMLAGIIKAPTNYSPFINYKKCFDRKNLVLKQMLNEKYITQEEYQENINKEIELSTNENIQTQPNTYLYLVKKQLNDIVKNSPYTTTHLNVYTYFNKDEQDKINNQLSKSSVECEKSAILMNNKGQIVAYNSSCGDIPRQLGSVIKPLIAYAPAIELNKVYQITKLNDQITDFNGYKPNNYNDKYLGEISCTKALTSSSNVCAVKLLNSVGVNYALNYLKKMQFSLSNNDNSLSLALGNFENGIRLSTITSAYTVFNNSGYYYQPSLIDRITDKNKNNIYKSTSKNEKIFSKDTISIMNDMLREVVNSGTAKKLSFCTCPLYAKTGTVGNKNGNTDAYTISYNSQYILGVWLGNLNNCLLSNNITGGGEPSNISYNIWNDIYSNKSYPNEIEKKDVIELDIDKISYDNENKIILADKIAPERFKLKCLFKLNNIPTEQSTRFSSPKIEKPKISINNNEIEIFLCLTECFEIEIYRTNNNEYNKIYDSKEKNKKHYIDKNILPNTIYTYKVIPYYFDGKVKHYGKEIILEKIKSPILNISDNWWQDD